MLIRDGYQFRTLDDPIVVNDNVIRAIFCGNNLIYPEYEDVDSFQYHLAGELIVSRDDNICSVGYTNDAWQIPYLTKEAVEIDFSARFSFDIRSQSPIFLIKRQTVKRIVTGIPVGSSGIFPGVGTDTQGEDSSLYSVYQILFPGYEYKSNDLLYPSGRSRASYMMLSEGHYRLRTSGLRWAHHPEEPRSTWVNFANYTRSVQSGDMASKIGYLAPGSAEAIKKLNSLNASSFIQAIETFDEGKTTWNTHVDGLVEGLSLDPIMGLSGGTSTQSITNPVHKYTEITNLAFERYAVMNQLYPLNNMRGLEPLISNTEFHDTETGSKITGAFGTNFIVGSGIALTGDVDWWFLAHNSDSDIYNFPHSRSSWSSILNITENNNPECESYEEYLEYINKGHSVRVDGLDDDNENSGDDGGSDDIIEEGS